MAGHYEEAKRIAGPDATPKQIVDTFNSMERTRARGSRTENVASQPAGYFIVVAQVVASGRPEKPVGELLRGLHQDKDFPDLRIVDLADLVGLDPGTTHRYLFR